MRILFVISIICFLFTTADAQSRRKKKKGEKIYVSTFLNINFDPTSTYYDSPISEVVDQFGTTVPGILRRIQTNDRHLNFGFSIQKLKKNNKYTEFSLTRFRFGQTSNVIILEILGEDIIEPIFGSTETFFETGFRIEHGKYFNINHDESRLRIGIAGGLTPYFNYNGSIPKTSASFSARLIRYGLQTNFITSISYQVSKNGHFELKWLPSIFDFNRNFSSTDNPILTKNQRSTSYSEPAFFSTPLSFQVHYKHQILGKKASKKAFKKKKKEKKETDQKNKFVASYVTPFINIYPDLQKLNFVINAVDIDNRITSFNDNYKSFFGIGLGFQFVKEKGGYTELALTQFILNRRIDTSIQRYGNIPNFQLPTEKDQLTFSYHIIAARYEIGKIFGDLIGNRQKTFFSIGMGLEPYYYSQKFGRRSSNLGAVLKFTPALSFKFSHRTFLQIKWAPTLLNGYYQFYDDGGANPFFKENNWNIDPISNPWNFNVGFRLRI